MVREKMSTVSSLVKFVGSYKERDKLIRLCQYALRFLAGNAQTRWGQRFAVVGAELGYCRSILRLFDDIPMLAYTLQYGTGSEERNWWLRLLELISNVANQLYYPLEHIAWFANKKLIDRPPEKWAVGCIVAWGVSLFTEILKAITRIRLIRKAQQKLHKETELEAKKERDSSEMPQTIRNQIRALKAQELDCYLAFFENLADFMNAINWLPPRFLWSGKLSSRTCGALGTISSFIKMYRIHSPIQKLS